MGQHKFEEQIRRRLREREITPSPQAWNKLNERLEKEEKKSRSYYWFGGIAASITAGILIFSLVFNSKTIEETPTIVDGASENVEMINDDNNLEMKEEKKEQLYSDEQIAAEEIKEPEPEKVTESIAAPVVTKNADDQIASVSEIEEVQEVVGNEIFSTESEILPQTLKEVIAEVSSEVTNKDLTEAEVDALLYKAAAEISFERAQENFSGKIDATALLRDVERELDDSFREKVFEILKEGYLKAKTAVANRNF